MTQNTDFEKTVNELYAGFLKPVGNDPHNGNYIGNDIYMVQRLTRERGKEVVMLACLETLILFDERKKLAKLDDQILGKPGVIISEVLNQASQNMRATLLKAMLEKVDRVSPRNTIFFKTLENTASSFEGVELARTLRNLYKKSSTATGKLADIILLKAGDDAIPHHKRLLQDLRHERAWSSKADIRRAFAQVYQPKIQKLVRELEHKYPKGSLFETLTQSS
jgi:hypothetical protein